MTKPKHQIRPRLLKLTGTKRPKKLRQLCEFIHFKEIPDRRFISLKMLYAYYPCTVAHPTYLPKYLVRTSDNPFYRIDIDEWHRIALIYIEEVMNSIIDTGAPYLLPENCGELSISKMKKAKLTKEDFELYDNETMNFAEFYRRYAKHDYSKFNGYQPVFFWKRKGYGLVRHRQMFSIFFKPQGYEKIIEHWTEDPGLVYAAKTYKRKPTATNNLRTQMRKRND